MNVNLIFFNPKGIAISDDELSKITIKVEPEDNVSDDIIVITGRKDFAVNPTDATKACTVKLTAKLLDGVDYVNEFPVTVEIPANSESASANVILFTSSEYSDYVNELKKGTIQNTINDINNLLENDVPDATKVILESAKAEAEKELAKLDGNYKTAWQKVKSVFSRIWNFLKSYKLTIGGFSLGGLQIAGLLLLIYIAFYK